MKERLDYLNNTETPLMSSLVKELTDKLGEGILCIRVFGCKGRFPCRVRYRHVCHGKGRPAVHQKGRIPRSSRTYRYAISC